MKAKMLVSSIALIGGLALAAPSFAQGQGQTQTGQAAQVNADANTTQGNAPMAGQMPSAQGPAAGQSSMNQNQSSMPGHGMGQDQANMQDRNMGASQDQAQNEQPMMHRKMRHHTRHARLRHERNDEGNGAGVMGARYGTDVAPGGGRYTRQDVAEEGPGRMSHPGVGSPRAPSDVAKGPLVRVNEAENAETARLNEQQLTGTPTAPAAR